MNTTTSDPTPATNSGPAVWFVQVASWVLAAMALVAFCDVILRIAGRPITGAYELTALLMGLLVYATLPLVTAQDEHVRAGILQMWRTAPAGLGRALFQLRRLLSCIALAYLAWALLWNLDVRLVVSVGWSNLFTHRICCNAFHMLDGHFAITCTAHVATRE